MAQRDIDALFAETLLGGDYDDDKPPFLGALSSLSGVPEACSHRFRHTLAAEILETG